MCVACCQTWLKWRMRNARCWCAKDLPAKIPGCAKKLAVLWSSFFVFIMNTPVSVPPAAVFLLFDSVRLRSVSKSISFSSPPMAVKPVFVFEMCLVSNLNRKVKIKIWNFILWRLWIWIKSVKVFEFLRKLIYREVLDIGCNWFGLQNAINLKISKVYTQICGRKVGH